MREKIKKFIPKPLLLVYRFFANPQDAKSLISFLFNSSFDLSFGKRLGMIRKMYATSLGVNCHHTEQEMISYITTILSLPKEVKGSIVEAGCFKGGSTAKFSMACKLAGRELVVFDSFEGIPDNDEPHSKNIFGGGADFPEGSYCGALEEVKNNVSKFGSIESCTFIKGWFDNTMPGFDKPVAAVYLDVDLVSSTRTCIEYLYPLMSYGGVMYSQDGHLPLVLELLDDESFWQNDVGFMKPEIEGFGKKKLIRVVKKPGSEFKSGQVERSAS